MREREQEHRRAEDRENREPRDGAVRGTDQSRHVDARGRDDEARDHIDDRADYEHDGVARERTAL